MMSMETILQQAQLLRFQARALIRQADILLAELRQVQKVSPPKKKHHGRVVRKLQ